jgi:hypothetical protein
MIDNSREATIAKYTDKSRYKPEYTYGNVYVDEERIKHSNNSKEEKKKYEREFNTAKRYSEKFGLEIFMLPTRGENGHIYFVC